MGQMIYMSYHLNYETQIDRACAAQSPEMLPDIPVSKPSSEQLKADITSRYFNGS